MVLPSLKIAIALLFISVVDVYNFDIKSDSFRDEKTNKSE